MASLGAIWQWWPLSRRRVLDDRVELAAKISRLSYELGKLQVRYSQRCERNGELRVELFKLRRNAEQETTAIRMSAVNQVLRILQSEGVDERVIERVRNEVT